MTLTIENANEDLLKAIRAMAKPFNAKVKIKESSMDRALKEVKNGEVIQCKNFKEFKRMVLA